MRFEDLDVWKRAARLSTNIYQEMESCQNYGFKDQITRSALSVASNIAEGYERGSYRDCIKFLNYAKGSAGEVRTQAYIGVAAGFVGKETGDEWIRESEELSRMLYSLIKSFSA